jgi:hypothetical protein
MDILLYQKLMDTFNIQRKLTTERSILSNVQATSLANSKAKYDDTASTIFTEGWNNLTAWTLYGTPGMQVSGNKLYSVGTGGGNSGATHSYALGVNENLRAVFNITLSSSSSDGGLIVGVSNDVAGAVPQLGGSKSFGLYFREGGAVSIMNNGTLSATPEGLNYSSGDYVVTVTVDQTYISVVAAKLDGTLELSGRRLRAGFSVNNLYIFNSDSRALTGQCVNSVSARKGLQTISPRNYGEGNAKTVQWTGDGTQSFRIYLPKTYDSRIPSPLAICFHGNGSSEINWSMGFGDTNYGKLQKELTDAGYIVLACSLDSNKYTWGNTASTNAYYQAYKYTRDNYAIGSVVIFANSMGGIESLNALSENKIPCVAWAGTAPTFNLKNCYDNATFTSLIKSAYGIASDGSDYVTKTAGRDPSLMSALTFRGIPMWMAGASDDTAVSKSENMDKLFAKVSSTALEIVKVDVPSGNGGHGFDIAPYTSAIVKFFNKYVGL